MTVEKRQLGRTGFQATVLGIGDLADRSVPLDQCVATVRRAMDFGLNVIDTAPGYEDGYSERIVGEALKGRRGELFVIDKIDQLNEPVGPQVEQSLRRLAVDMADLFVFHDVSAMAQWDLLAVHGGAMEELGEVIQAGKVRFRGISSHNPEVLLKALASGTCDVVMFPVGPFVDTRFVKQVLPLAKSQGVGTVCFKTFGAGKLLGDTSGYNRPLEARPRGKFSSGGNSQTNVETELPRLSVADCLHYTLTFAPDVALLGMSFPNEQDAAFAALKSFEPMNCEQLEETRRRASLAIQGKGPCWWNPADS